MAWITEGDWRRRLNQRVGEIFRIWGLEACTGLKDQHLKLVRFGGDGVAHWCRGSHRNLTGDVTTGSAFGQFLCLLIVLFEGSLRHLMLIDISER